MTRRRHDAMGYLSERFGGLEQRVPRSRQDLLWGLFRLAKDEASRYFDYRSQSLATEAQEMMGSLPMDEVVEITKESQQWGVVAHALKAFDVVIPQPSADPDRTENPRPRKRKVKVYVEEEDDDQGEPQGV